MFNFVHHCTNYRKYNYLRSTISIIIQMMLLEQDQLLTNYGQIIEVNLQLNFMNHNICFLLNDYCI